MFCRATNALGFAAKYCPSAATSRRARSFVKALHLMAVRCAVDLQKAGPPIESGPLGLQLTPKLVRVIGTLLASCSLSDGFVSVAVWRTGTSGETKHVARAGASITNFCLG